MSGPRPRDRLGPGRFKITAGNIRNVALSAAYFTATASGELGMAHAVRAASNGNSGSPGMTGGPAGVI